MDYKKSTNRIWMEDKDGKEIAFVSFPAVDKGVVTITSTVVDPSLRGQGVAGDLMETLAKELRDSNRKAIPICSYAIKWFSDHPEQGDLLDI